jgi:putative transcriptional regulator
VGCVRNGDRPQVFQARWAIVFSVCGYYVVRMHQSQAKMGYVRLRIRELAEERGWTIKEVADLSGVNYNTVKSYIQRDALNTVDLSAVYKIARAFEVTLEDLVEVLEE